MSASASQTSFCKNMLESNEIPRVYQGYTDGLGGRDSQLRNDYKGREGVYFSGCLWAACWSPTMLECG